MSGDARARLLRRIRAEHAAERARLTPDERLAIALAVEGLRPEGTPARSRDEPPELWMRLVRRFRELD